MHPGVFVPQVQPDLDELPVNMEDNEDAESTKSEVKLGKLQFSLDYDFQKGEVGSLFIFIYMSDVCTFPFRYFSYVVDPTECIL